VFRCRGGRPTFTDSRSLIEKQVLVQAVREIIRRDGLRRGMFAGYGAFLLRDLPFDAIEFWAFDTLNMRLQTSLKRQLNPVEHGVCGAIAGAITWAHRDDGSAGHQSQAVGASGGA